VVLTNQIYPTRYEEANYCSLELKAKSFGLARPLSGSPVCGCVLWPR
jgi:hypothetical protein